MASVTNRLYHGSVRVVDHPMYGFGNARNDYGRGLYCTASRNLAAEWACKAGGDGYVNAYALDEAGLRVLDLLCGDFTVLHWMALLLANRSFALDSDIALGARDFLLRNYLPDLSAFDVVVGYRADDSYFAFAEAFVKNGLSVRRLEQALRLGNLGEQTVLISRAAFDRLVFLDAEKVEASQYYKRFVARDTAARQAYRACVAAARVRKDDLFVFDIMRQGMSGDDERLQRLVRR